MKRIHLLFLTAVLLLAALVFAGCSKTTKISSILDTPDRYMGREVTVGGKVTKTYAVNLVIAELGAYQIDDGTGKIWVTTKNGVPQEGQTVGLKGNVSKGLKIAGQAFGVVLSEVERRTK